MMFRFIDHLTRFDRRYRLRSHKLETVHQYMDYFHVTVDVVAKLLKEREINTIVFTYVPHLAYDTLLYDVAKLFNIRTVIWGNPCSRINFLLRKE